MFVICVRIDLHFEPRLKMIRKSMILITLILFHANFYDSFGFNMDNCVNFKCRMCGIRLIHALNVTCNGCFSSLGVLHHTDVKREIRIRKDLVYEIFANQEDDLISNFDRALDDDDDDETEKYLDHRSLDFEPKALSSASKKMRITQCCRKGCTIGDLRKYCYYGCWWLKDDRPADEPKEEHSQREENILDFPTLDKQ
uniref:Insulin-like domain-containing protein n=1 Tax=Romanomermis culicivorax TaxID=13658 RepID=A0A915L8M9_ROMCU